MAQKHRNHTTFAGGKFGKYRPESESISRTVDMTEAVAEIRNRFLSVDPDEGLYLDRYPVYLSALRGLRFAPKDVEFFSVMLSEFQDMKNFNENAGMFLSALVNSGPDRLYTIRSGIFDAGFETLGCYNTKNLIVLGNAGDALGTSMMRGRILVKGDSGSETGSAMHGGTILIKGNTGRFLGHDMTGGSIHILGSIEEIGNTRGGKIYNNHKLVRGALDD